MIGLELDAAALARAEAFAASRGTTLGALVESHVRELGHGLTAAMLPDNACFTFLRMFRHGGRDTTATFLADGAWDEFEHPMPAHLYNWVRSHAGIVIDGGAHTGFYSLLAAAASAGARVLAFEPDPTVRELLQSNIAANGLGDRIAVSPAALSGSAGRAPLYVPPQDHGMIETSSSMEPGFKSRFSEVLNVETSTVDQVVAALPSGEQRVTVLKLDVAGHEAAALDGSEATVTEHRPVVFAEVLDRADFGRLSRFVARHNYIDVPLRSTGQLHPQAAVTFERDAWNHAFVPAEVLPAFLVALRPGR